MRCATPPSGPSVAARARRRPLHDLHTNEHGQSTAPLLVLLFIGILMFTTPLVWLMLARSQRTNLNAATDAAAAAASQWAVYTATLDVTLHQDRWEVQCNPKGEGCHWSDTGGVPGSAARATVSGTAWGQLFTGATGLAGAPLPGWAAAAGCNTSGTGSGGTQPPLRATAPGQTWTWTVCDGWTRASTGWTYTDPGGARQAAAYYLASDDPYATMTNFTIDGSGAAEVDASRPAPAQLQKWIPSISAHSAAAPCTPRLVPPSDRDPWLTHTCLPGSS